MSWCLRESVYSPQYSPHNNLFTIKLHYGGFLIGTENLSYEGGKVDWFDFCDPNDITCVTIAEMAAEVGCYGISRLYYKRVGSSFHTDLVQLVHDREAYEIGKFVDENRVVEVYTETDYGHYSSSSSDEENEFDDDNVSELESFDGSDEEKGRDDDGIGMYNMSYNEPSISGGSKVSVSKRKGKGSGKPKPKYQGPSLNNSSDVDIDDGYVTASELNSESEKDEGEGEGGHKMKYKHYSQSDKTQIQFKVGMKFPTTKEFRDVVHNYGIQQAKDVHLWRNTAKKMIGECRFEGCLWYIYASKCKGEETVQIKTYRDIHSCPRALKNNNSKPKFIAEKYARTLKNNPKWDAFRFKQQIFEDMKCEVSIGCAYRAMAIAKTMNEGSSAEQYAVLWDYIGEIERSNPNTTVVMKVRAKAGFLGESRFKRLYICWGSLKEGFLQGCMPLFGVDGCHLTGPEGGVLLTAVAIDANNCLYPFAYAVVDIENYKNWKWFLNLLKVDLKLDIGVGYTLMSDKQKGLIKAVDKILPSIEHRFCVRHLYNNFKLNFKGQLLKDLLWKTARASTIQHFEKALKEIKEINEQANEWLSSKPGHHWSRSHFSTYPKSDLLLNNLCESFNACIKVARGMPILTMLEMIRVYLMDFVMRKSEAMKKKNCLLTPKIYAKVEHLRKESHSWACKYNGDNLHEVDNFHSKYTVNLPLRECACRVWQLTGIPCTHAIAALHHMHEDPQQFVHACYTRETYMRTYSHTLKLINGQDMWLKTQKPLVLPPIVAKKIGKPKKARRRDAEEIQKAKEDKQARKRDPAKMSRKGYKVKCTKCGKFGHNSRGCGKPTRKRKFQSEDVRVEPQLEDESDSSSNGEKEDEVVIENVVVDGRQTETQNEQVNVSQNEGDSGRNDRELGFDQWVDFVDSGGSTVNLQNEEGGESFWEEVVACADKMTSQSTQSTKGEGQPCGNTNPENEPSGNVPKPKKMQVTRKKTLGVRKSGRLSYATRQKEPNAPCPPINLSDDEEEPTRKATREEPSTQDSTAFHAGVCTQESSAVTDKMKEKVAGDDRLHCGIMAPNQEQLPSGQIKRKGKVYHTIASVRAARAAMKDPKKSKNDV